MKIAYLPGVWDFCHSGHRNIIKRAKDEADFLVVGAVSDNGVYAYKGKFPIMSEQERLGLVLSLKWVDFAIIQHETDPTRELEVIRPDVLIHGDDWDELKEGHGTLDRLGIEFKLLPYTKGISSTLIRENL